MKPRPAPGFYGNKTRTREQKRAALVAMLTMRRTLDGVTASDLQRSYGLPVGEIDQLLTAESRRRARHG